MPEKLDRCVSDVTSDGKSKDSAYAICNSTIKEQVAKSMASRGMTKESHVKEHGTYLPSGEHKDKRLKDHTQEHDNPLDIPFGYEVNETVCKPCEQERSNKHAILESLMGLNEGGKGSGIKGHTTAKDDGGDVGSPDIGIGDSDSPFSPPPPTDNLDDFGTVGEPSDEPIQDQNLSDATDWINAYSATGMDQGAITAKLQGMGIPDDTINQALNNVAMQTQNPSLSKPSPERTQAAVDYWSEQFRNEGQSPEQADKSAKDYLKSVN